MEVSRVGSGMLSSSGGRQVDGSCSLIAQGRSINRVLGFHL